MSHARSAGGTFAGERAGARRTAAVLSLLLAATALMAWAQTSAPTPGATAPAPPSSHALPAGRAPLPSATLPPPLARVLTDYETSWRKRDAAALAALFAEDGFVLPNGSPPVRGRAEIQRHYQGHGGPLSLRAYAFDTDGSSGWILGGYTGSEGTPDEGKFTLTLRKGADGRWLINSDMDNSNSRR